MWDWSLLRRPVPAATAMADGRRRRHPLMGTKAGQVRDDNGLKIKLGLVPAGGVRDGQPERGKADIEMKTRSM